MIIFLYGADIQRLNQNLAEIILAYKKKHSSGLNIFYLSSDDPRVVSKLEDAVRSISFFDEVKLVSLRNVFEDTKVSQEVGRIVKTYNLGEDKKVTLLVSAGIPESELVKKDKDLFKLLTKGNSLARNFESLKGKKFQKEAVQ